ncbi:ThuA domain-containing protein [Sphingomonas sp. SUN039]|uniref:ThuA domain-containing protein n=1 Tax=Sphingomonas sp. SUN039 TaxID=2937787 RepID=UPI002164BE03|nr:ThuA domain-containing protein [Sphingomonas sp. SUN039]UVO53121.1 ThuA domain-containing protein [Sphingomonas sp. SUN039]
MKRLLLAATALLSLTGQAPAPERKPPPGYEDPYAGKKRLLVIADLSTGNQSAHMAVSHAAAVIEQIGRASGAYVTFIRTDTDWISAQETWGKGDYAKGGPKQARGKNLSYFDAVLFYTNGETSLSEAQKADLLAWIKSGKGFVGVHTATATGTKWPEYGDMIGAYFDNHPWMIANAKIIVERPKFPAMKPFRTGMALRDEHYQMRAPYDRNKVDVLARLDPASVDLKAPMVHRTDNDFPIAWIKSYGKGRVFYSGLGHTDASWDDPRMRTMYLEGIKWALGSGDTVPHPHPIPAK